MSIYGIPAVDLHDFTQGTPETKQAFVKQIGDAFENVGFVAVKNHGASQELQKKLYNAIQQFFNLPISTKNKYNIKGGKGQRGYTPFGTEHAKDSQFGDLKEFWHFGQYLEEEDKPNFPYPDNINCSEVPTFSQYGEEMYKALENTGKDILKAIALHLGLEEVYFDHFVEKGNSILRPIHYPPIIKEPSSAVRAGAHEDINLITLLVGASADGLQVLNHHNEWVPVTVLDEHIVVNVGDMLQRLTNRKLISTTHRVVNPPKEKWGESRYSIPFFLHPIPSMPLNCLPSCCKEREKQFEDITAWDYLMERLAAIGLK